MITEVVARAHQKDPVWGKWCVDGPKLDVWVDASSLATVMSLEHDGAVVEDASRLRKERDMQHINLAELDAVLKGINMALMWEATILQIHTDSACVHKWITDTLTGKARVHSRAASEMLIRRGHPGVRRTLYFIRQVNPTVSKASVRTIVRNCKKCQSIDPPFIRWPKGKLGVSNTWSQVGMDITHYQSRHYRSLTVGPHDSQFSVV